MQRSELPLSGLKVLDLSRLLPGPYATLVLADLGAQVDKVEDPRGGDLLRDMAPTVAGEGALFYALSRNKRSLVLDLKSKEGAAALLKLVSGYDVLVESFRPGVMERLGVGYETVHEKNPRLVYCSISGYGQSGPDRLKAGHDINYIARSGVLGTGGIAGGSPLLPGAQIADIGGGSLFALVGILAALHERSRTGQGRWVDISMTEGAAAFLHMHLSARLLTKEGPSLDRGTGTLNGGYACYNVYRTRDGRYLSVGSLEPKFFLGLCEKLGRMDLVTQGHDSGENGQKARSELAAVFAQKTLAEWLKHFEGSDLCIEPIHEGDEVFEDPQLQARGMFVRSHDSVRGMDVTHLRTPLHFGPLPVQPPPQLGAHTREILTEAGFSQEELQRLTASSR